MHNSCVCYILHVRQLQGKFYKMIFGFNTRVKPSPIKKESGSCRLGPQLALTHGLCAQGTWGPYLGCFPNCTVA